MTNCLIIGPTLGQFSNHRLSAFSPNLIKLQAWPKVSQHIWPLLQKKFEIYHIFLQNFCKEFADTPLYHLPYIDSVILHIFNGALLLYNLYTSVHPLVFFPSGSYMPLYIFGEEGDCIVNYAGPQSLKHTLFHSLT